MDALEHLGRVGNLAHYARRTFHARTGPLANKQSNRLTTLFTDNAYVEVEAIWGAYQWMITTYRRESCHKDHDLLVKLIASVSISASKALIESFMLG